MQTRAGVYHNLSHPERDVDGYDLVPVGVPCEDSRGTPRKRTCVIIFQHLRARCGVHATIHALWPRVFEFGIVWGRTFGWEWSGGSISSTLPSCVYLPEYKSGYLELCERDLALYQRQNLGPYPTRWYRCLNLESKFSVKTRVKTCTPTATMYLPFHVVDLPPALLYAVHQKFTMASKSDVAVVG